MRRNDFRRSLQCGVLVLVSAVVLGTVSADDVKQGTVPAKKAEVEKADAGDKAEDAAKGEAKDADANGNEKPAPANPLGRIFGRLFERPDNQPILPQVDPETERVMDRRDRARDNIDLRAPQKLAQTKRLRTAERLVEEERYDQAYDYLEAILGLRDPTLEAPEDSLVRSVDGQWVSIRWEVNRLIGELPDELLEQHRLAHGPEAETQLAEARKQHDLAAIAEVAMRYFQTEAGQQAANLLGSLHFERGEFGLASRWFSRLLDAEAPLTQTPAWRLKAVLAFTRSEQRERAEPLIERLRTEGGLARVRVGGAPLEFPRWLTAIDVDNGYGTIPGLEDWPAPYGTPQRIGRHVGNRPLLVPRWRVADAAVEDSSRRIGRQLEWLMLDLRDSGYPAIPSIQPIAVEGRIAYRTLGGVNVVDAETGRKLWETDRGISPLVLLGAEATEGQSGVQTHVAGYNGYNPENHQLTNLLVRNGLWGTVTSDGDRLFVVEDQAVMMGDQRNYNRWGRQMNVGFKSIGTKTLDFASNRLTAYNLDTGRPVWSVGGPRSDEPFAPPLEGTYFFGTPVAEGGELFTIGERADEIRLVSIDPATGGRNWSQLIALTDVDIDEDAVRRTFSAQVAVGEGIVVCPTTVGWLVAVDRLNHTVLWAQRYSPAPTEDAPVEHVEEFNATQYRMLGQRWSPSAPIIVGNRVIFSPEEEAALYCFDLYDGRELWERTMQGHLYVAGVHGDNVLLVGRDRIDALSLADGRRSWSIDVAGQTVVAGAPVETPNPFGGQPLPPMPMPMDHHDHTHGPFETTTASDRAIPSGRGVMIGDEFHVPMTNGEIWTIDLVKGELAERAYLEDGEQPLGNLVVHGDGLYSASAFGLRAFEPRGRFEASIAARNEDADTALKQAELHFLHHRYGDALEMLRSRSLDDVPETIREPYRRALVRALVEVVRRTPDSDVDVDQLQSIARTPEERLRFRYLVAGRFEALGRTEEAFRAYLDLVDDVDDDQPYELGEGLSVRTGTWLAGRLADTWNGLDEATRGELTPTIEERADRATKGSTTDQRRFSDLFAFHPASTAVELGYVKAIAEVEPLAVVENRLNRRLLRADDDAAAAEGRALLDRLLAAAEVPDDTTPAAPDWGDVDVELLQTKDYSSNENSYAVDPSPGRSPFVRGHRFVVHQQPNHFSGGYQVRRLEITNARTGKRYWMPALRADDNGGNANVSVCRTADNLVFLSYMDVLTVLSPVDRRIVWTRRLGNRQQLSTFYRNVNQNSRADVTLHYGPQVTGESGVVARSQHEGQLAVANADYVCLYGRRRITVHDAATGELRWELDDLPAGTQVYGNENLLIVSAGGQTTVRRPFDGRVLERPELADLVQRSLDWDEDGLVLVENKAGTGLLGLTGVKTVVRRRNTEKGTDDWTVEFPRNSGFTRLGDDTLFALEPKGGVSLLDLRTGEKRDLEPVPEDLLRSRGEVHVLADAGRVFVAVSVRGNNGNVMTDDNIPHVRFNGTLVALDRESGKKLWQRTIDPQALLLPAFEHSPFVVFASRKYVNNRNFSYWMSSRLLLDKRTGRVLYDKTVGSNNGYQSMSVDVGRRFVELRAYDGRTIFQAVPRRAEGDADSGGDVTTSADDTTDSAGATAAESDATDATEAEAVEAVVPMGEVAPEAR